MANWLNVYQQELEPDADALEKSENRKNFLLHLKVYLLNTFVKNNKSELKIWLLEALRRLQIDSRTKAKKIRALFYERENRNFEFERSILKLIVADNATAVAKLLRSDHRIFKKYFQSGDAENRIKKWFDWFSYEHVNTKYGAVALQSFAFKNRNDVWDRFLVWNSKRSVTPVFAVVQPWLMMQLNVVESVKNLLDDPREEFWTSRELDESLSNGEFLKILDNDYFIDELTRILNGERNEELRKELRCIIDSWMDEFSFESVCKNCFHSLNDEQLLQIIKDLIPPKNSPKLMQSYLTQLPTLDEIVLYNGLTDEYRATFVKHLLAEESKDSKALIDNLITSILSIGNEEQRKMDEISHWALKKKLKNERIQTTKTNYLSSIEFECLLLETFMIDFRLASLEPNREALESLMKRADLHFEAVEEESFKKRKKDKRNKKDKKKKENNDEEPKIKKIFIGWHIPAFDELNQLTTTNTTASVNQEESTNNNTSDLEKSETSNSNKRKFDAVSSTEQSPKNIYAMKELPYLLSKLFVRSSLEYAMS